MSLTHALRKSGPRRLLIAGASAAVVAATLAAAPAQASPKGAAGADGVPAQMVRAMVEDTGVSRPEAVRRLSTQAGKDALADRLTKALGARSAGAYIDRATGDLVVNVTSQAAAERTRGAGARARVVARSMGRLTEIESALDDSAVPGTTLAIDVRSNVVEVIVPKGDNGAAAKALIERAESFGDAVEVTRAAGMPTTQALFGGEAIFGSGVRCSAAFNTRSRSGTEYVLTAGHCGRASSSWSVDEGFLGQTAAASFPGNDYAAIRNSGSVATVGAVLYNGGSYEITNAGNPPVGTFVCKTGSTSGTTCGNILGYNVTVNYPEGTVRDLIETDVCTQPGDSGGALYASGNQAVGIVSGGTTIGCSSSSFRSFFENVTEALNTYGLTLE